MHRRAWFLAVLAPFVAVGCGNETTTTDSREAATETRMPPLWRRDGLEAQPRLADLRSRIPPDLGHTPATTAWQPTRRELPASLADPDRAQADAPGIILYRLIEAWNLHEALGQDVWEHTARVHIDADDHAYGVVLAWGLQDDALAGTDLRVRMRRQDAGWFVTEVDERYQCARGVTEDGLCI
jgi:hypothetical protein